MVKNKNTNNSNYNIIIFIIIQYPIYLYNLPRYIPFLPTLPIYPDIIKKQL